MKIINKILASIISLLERNSAERKIECYCNVNDRINLEDKSVNDCLEELEKHFDAIHYRCLEKFDFTSTPFMLDHITKAFGIIKIDNKLCHSNDLELIENVKKEFLSNSPYFYPNIIALLKKYSDEYGETEEFKVLVRDLVVLERVTLRRLCYKQGVCPHEI